MSREFTSALTAEIASLEAELDQDVRYIRLRELRRVLQLYGDAIPYAQVSVSTPRAHMTDHPKPRTAVRQPSPDRERALAAAKDYVRKMGRIVPTREALEHLKESAIEVGGVSPLNNLSAMMSTSGSFQSHGRRGWTILEEKTDVDPRDSDMMRDDQIMQKAEAETERLAAEEQHQSDKMPQRALVST